MIIIFIGTEILIILFLFLLFRRKDYFSIAIIENTLRVRLIFILLILLPLLFLFTLYVGEFSKTPPIITIINLIINAKGVQKLIMILTQVLLLIALLTMPLITVFHLCFGYRRFFDFIRKQNDYTNDDVIVLLKDIIKKAMKTTELKTEPTLFLVRKNVGDSIPGFTGCGIIGKGTNNLALLVSEDFVDLFRRGVLSKKEMEAIFLHELSHVLHKDHFIPLWARSFVPSPAFTIATTCCILSLFFGFLRMGLSSANIIVLTLLLFGMYLFRAIIMQVTAHVIRQREHLADIRTAYFYNLSTELIEALKKMYLFIVPRKSVSGVSQFMDKFTTYSEDEYIEIVHNLKEALLGLKQRFLDFFLIRVYWYSKASSRIRAIREKRNVMVDIGPFLSPFSIVGLSFLALSCSLIVSASLSFLEIDPNLRQKFSFFLSYTIATVLIFMNCLPLRFAQTEVFRKAFIPASWKQLPLHFFISKFWGNMHVNNLFIFTASIVCLTINAVIIDFRDGLVLFSVYTILSMLFMILIYIKKLKRKENNEPFVI